MLPITSINSPYFFPQKNRTAGKRRRFQSDFEQTVPSVRFSKQPRSEYLVESVTESVQTQSLSRDQLEKTRLRELETRIADTVVGYTFVEGAGVRRFISKNPFLLPLLKEIPEKISDYFIRNYSLSLELTSDPDFPQSVQLWVNVVTTETAAEARPKMDEFDMDWWLDNIDKAKEKLNITLNYV